MPAETSFAKIAYALAADETKAFPAEVSEKGAKTIDKYLEEHTFTLKKRAASYNGVSGEWGLQESNAKTMTLPAAATASQVIAISSAVAEAKVTTSGGAFIYGKWLTVAGKTATVILTEDQTAFFFSDGTNWILWGEIKDERTYGAVTNFTKVEAETGVEPSATRPAFVVLNTAAASLEVVTIGARAFNVTSKAGEFIVPAGLKWKALQAVETSTLLL